MQKSDRRCRKNVKKTQTRGLSARDFLPVILQFMEIIEVLCILRVQDLLISDKTKWTRISATIISEN